MRVLLLGASGFLGSHVNQALAAEPDLEVVRQVHRPSPDAIMLDLLGTDDGLAELLARTAPDAVVNCAGTTADVGKLDALNVELVARLLRAMAPHARLVHLGSAAEYGPTPRGEPISETTPARPVSPYGASKLAATELVRTAVADGLDGLVLRVFNPIGAGMPAGSLPGNAAQRLHEAIAAGSSSVYLGPLDDWRDFLAASDVGGAVVAALRARDLREPIVNIGRGEAIQVRELVRRLTTIAGFDGEVREDAPASVRSATVPWQQADTTLALTLLGWRAQGSLDEALRQLWRSV
jgi:nucleoside-diphosphate-sugar epimerase